LLGEEGGENAQSMPRLEKKFGNTTPGPTMCKKSVLCAGEGDANLRKEHRELFFH